MCGIGPNREFMESRYKSARYKSYAVVTFVTAGGAKKAMESRLRVPRIKGAATDDTVRRCAQ